MGQKIHPTGFRLAVTRAWQSRWFATKGNFATMLAEDLRVREYLKTKLKSAAVSRILIERPAKNARITIYSARPGVVIGKKGEDIENLKAELARREAAAADGLQAELAEGDLGPVGGHALVAALLLLAVFPSSWLQHVSPPVSWSSCPPRAPQPRAARPCRGPRP